MPAQKTRTIIYWISAVFLVSAAVVVIRFNNHESIESGKRSPTVIAKIKYGPSPNVNTAIQGPVESTEIRPQAEKLQQKSIPKAERVKMINEARKEFKKLVLDSEFERAKLVNEKSTDTQTIVDYVVRKPSETEFNLILERLKTIQNKYPATIREEIKLSLNAELDERKERYAGKAPYQVVTFMIPTDPTRTPTVTERGVNGDDAESMKTWSYMRTGPYVLDYPHLIKMEQATEGQASVTGK